MQNISETCQTATQLVARNVPSTVTEALLHHIFSQFGPLHHICRSEGVAFVDFERPNSASCCLFNQAALTNYVIGIHVEVSRMHWDRKFLMSSQEARMKFISSNFDAYDRLAKWITDADNRASHRNLQQAIDTSPQNLSRGETVRNGPHDVEDFTNSKKSKKGPIKKKPDRRTEVADKRSLDRSLSPELSRKPEPDAQVASKTSKKKNQQTRRSTEQIGLSETKALSDPTVLNRAAFEPPQPTRKLSVRKSSLTEALVEEIETVSVVAEQAKEPDEPQAAKSVEKVDADSSEHGASPSASAYGKALATTPDVNESINISDSKIPDATQALNAPAGEVSLREEDSVNSSAISSHQQTADPVHITTQVYAEVAEMKQDNKHEMGAKASQPEPDSQASQDPEITAKTDDPVPKLISRSPSVDPIAGRTRVDTFSESSPVTKKDAPSVECANVTSTKKENKPKGPPATESLSQFGRKNEKKPKPSKGKGSLKGKPRFADLDDARKPVTSLKSWMPVDTNVQTDKVVDSKSSKDSPAPIIPPVDVKIDPVGQIADKTEAQQKNVSDAPIVKSTGGWIPSFTGFLSKTGQSPKVAPAAVDPPAEVIVEEKVTSPKPEPEDVEELPSVQRQSDSASEESTISSPEIKIIVTRSSSPEVALEFETPRSATGNVADDAATGDVADDANEDAPVEPVDEVVEVKESSLAKPTDQVGPHTLT
jgi:hypothetical protein